MLYDTALETHGEEGAPAAAAGAQAAAWGVRVCCFLGARLHGPPPFPDTTLCAVLSAVWLATTTHHTGTALLSQPATVSLGL